jgi:hypothetical protein
MIRSYVAMMCVTHVSVGATFTALETPPPESKASGIADFIREAVWGGDKGGLYGHGVVTPKRDAPTKSSGLPAVPVTSLVRTAVVTARSLMLELEVEPDGRTVKANGDSRGHCYVGACCGWGHRLMRQAKTFTHVHFIQNRTMIMEWGPCPNSKGAAGSGDDRNADFSSLMIDDSPDIVNFQTNKCNNEKNADCAKCGAGNDINREKWEATVKHYGPKIKDIGNGGAMQVTAGSFFPPFQYFARSLLTQLKPEIKARIEAFLHENFGGLPVIGVHHRHGNGELDDFVDKVTGAPSGRLNKNNSKVIEWMVESVHELASSYGLVDYKVFFASDSPEMTRMYIAHDPRVFAFDQGAKEQLEGKGFIMPGWQGWGRSPGTSVAEKHTMCEPESIRAFLDMALLGYSDMLVISKRSSFTFFPSIMMASRRKPVCALVDGRKHTSFTCRITETNQKTNLLERLKADTGLAPSSRRRHR